MVMKKYVNQDQSAVKGGGVLYTCLLGRGGAAGDIGGGAGGPVGEGGEEDYREARSWRRSHILY